MKKTKTERTRNIFSVFLFLLTTQLSAQTISANTSRAMICHAWKLQMMEVNGVKQTPEYIQSTYLIQFDTNYTLQQGIPPDGMIHAKWKWDLNQNIITITDSATDKLYHVKILQLTAQNLILQDLDEKERSLIFYYEIKD
jgi:hypothetical protein